MKSKLTKSIFLIAVVSTFLVGSSGAYFSDTAVVSGNQFSTGTWNKTVKTNGEIEFNRPLTGKGDFYTKNKTLSSIKIVKIYDSKDGGLMWEGWTKCAGSTLASSESCQMTHNQTKGPLIKIIYEYPIGSVKEVIFDYN